MMACWCVKPAMRPSFTELAESLGGMLGESVKNVSKNMSLRSLIL